MRKTFTEWTTVLWSLQIPFWQQELFKNSEVLIQHRPTAMWVWAKGFLLLSFSLFKGKRFTAVILDKLSTLRNPSTQMSSKGELLTLCESPYPCIATLCPTLNKCPQWDIPSQTTVATVMVCCVAWLDNVWCGSIQSEWSCVTRYPVLSMSVSLSALNGPWEVGWVIGGVAVGWLNLLFSHCLSASTQLCELVFRDLGYFFPTVARPPSWWQSANSQTKREYDPLPPTNSPPADCWEAICCMVVLPNRPSTAFSGNTNKRSLNWVQTLFLK